MSKAAKRERQRLNRETRREIEEREAKRRRRLKALRNGLIVVVPIALVFTIFQVVRNDDGGGSEEETARAPSYATITTNLGDIVIELDPAEAPATVENFETLASDGFYNDTTIHRASTSVGVIQGGDPEGTGEGGPGYTIEDELPTDGPYEIGDVAMANTGAPDSAGSQWFIITSEAGTQLPQTYSRFGRVISGLDIAQLIQGLAPPEGDGPPTQPVTVVSVTISEENPVAPTPTTLAPGDTTPPTTLPETTSTVAPPPAS